MISRTILPRTILSWFLFCLLSGSISCGGETPVVPGEDALKPFADLADRVRGSVAVITTEGRDGNATGLGSGFVVRKDGIIATNYHVIGEGRQVYVQIQGEEKVPVVEIMASDRNLDLAILRIDRNNLEPLSLADESQVLRIGEQVVAMGHPLGLKNSVVSGFVAGEQEFEGNGPLWQVAMPIEPGNSGGPLLDLDGRVHGVLAMKSSGEQSFGFAIKTVFLKKLLDSPNPISIDNWKTLGRLDPTRWESRFGANWRQSGGRIAVEGQGNGFGGRSLLLYQRPVPEFPIDLVVNVKLLNEDGAAGLIFYADGQDRHYGFYPSNGRLRLTRFDGPTVYSWHVLHELDSGFYRPGEWNELKVHLEPNKVVAFINGQLLVTLDDVNLDKLHPPLGKLGLCTFRGTGAEFKNFRVAKDEGNADRSSEKLQELLVSMEELRQQRRNVTDDQLHAHLDQIELRRQTLQSRAQQLRQQADEWLTVAEDLHVQDVCRELAAVVSPAEDDAIDLLQGALMIARLVNEDLEPPIYVERVDQMAAAIRATCSPDATPAERLKALDTYLFQQQGFHGSRTEYYHAANSLIDRVIDDREGLPLSLSLLYISLAKRLELPVHGLGLPGHFIVRYQPPDGAAELIDVFDRGKRLTSDEARRMVERVNGGTLENEHWEPALHREILKRMLTNLLGVAQRDNDPRSMLRYLEGLVVVAPQDGAMRGMRAVIRHQQGRQQAALNDLDWILEHRPVGVDLDQVSRMREAFAR